MSRNSHLPATAEELEQLIIIEEQRKEHGLESIIENVMKSAKMMDDMKYGHLTKKERSADVQSIRSTPKVQRNEVCPCGSNKKYKKCCG